MELTGYEISLKPGRYIKAEWDADNGFGGSASYSFYVEADADSN